MPSKRILEPIAIVGIGCRFPGAPDPQSFWRLLRDGRDAVREISADRWDADAYYDPDPTRPGKIANRQGGLIDSVDEFDWKAFRIPPREAKYMDPQQRLLLEVAWEALEDAGLPFEKVAGGRVGVFIAIMWNDYLRMQSKDVSQLNGYSSTGNGFAFAAGRISYTFDLRGPSVAIDSACAGSLASVHAACQSLWMGEANLALAGGVNLILSPDVNIMLSKAGVLSSEGRCMTLDARADGFVRGEGAGVVVLKPLSQLEASDRVYALIRGSAITHNGHNEWIMAASPEGQEAALRDAYRMADINPAEVDYVELHGTGLPKGDPIEAGVVGKVIGTQPGRQHPCAIGSVKSNIGHLDSAAGIASIIKVALSLHHGEIPPTVNLKEINPNIPLESLGLVAQRTLTPWPSKMGQPLAGVTAISMSGVNAHMVLEGPSADHSAQLRADSVEASNLYLLPLSARSREALLSLAQNFKNYLNDETSGANFSLGDICFTAGVRRSHHAHRLAILVHSRPELIERLEAFLQGGLPAGIVSSQSVLEDQDLRPDLAAAIERCLQFRDPAGILKPPFGDEDEARSLVMEALGTLYTRGHELDWQTIFPDGGRCVQLPTTPWQRERLWLEWLDTPDRSSTVSEETKVSDETAEQSDFLGRLGRTPPDERQELLLAHVREQTADVLGIEQPGILKPQQRLFDFGLNSLSAVELVNRLGDSLGQSLPATLVFEFPTVEDLTQYLAQEVLHLERESASSAEPEDGDKPSREAFVAELEQLSDEEAEALLIKRLKEL